MSDEEDEDLELLRSAALASLGKKQSSGRRREREDLDALRRVALTSRKHHDDDDEEDIFEKLQPAKSSNLINLTPDPDAEPANAAKPKDKFSRMSSNRSINDADSDVDSKSPRRSSSVSSSSRKSSSDEHDSSENDQDANSDDEKEEDERSGDAKNEEVEGDVEKKTEEDDLLSAIDQFLDEGVIMLEEAITPAKQKPNSESVKTKQLKTKKVKKQKKEKFNSKKKAKKHEKDSTNRKKSNSDKEKTAPASTVKKRKLKENPVNANAEAKVSNKHKDEQLAWKSADLPLVKNRVSNMKHGDKHKTRNNEDDSVHSSDLSFLADSIKEDAEEGNPGSNNKLKVQAKKDRIRLNKNTDSSKNRRKPDISDMESMKSRIKDDSSDQSYPDLREKLKRRGLHRQSQHPDSPEPTAGGKAGETESKTIQVDVNRRNKIYMKPSVIFENNNGSSDPSLVMRSNLKNEESGRLIVTRNISNDNFAPITVRLANDENDHANRKSRPDKIGKREKDFRRKRNVVQFEPNVSASEKLKKLEMLKEQAEKEKLEERAFSDMSDQEFDDFEIQEEAGDNTNANAVDNDKKTEETVNDEETVPDTRRFVTAARVKTFDDVEKSAAKPVRKRLGKRQVKDSEPARADEAEATNEKRETLTDARSKLSRKNKHSKASTRKRDLPLDTNDKPPRDRESVQTKSMNSPKHWQGMEENNRRKRPSEFEDESHSKRIRRAAVSLKRTYDTLDLEEEEKLPSSGGKTVKQRLGFQQSTSPRMEKKRLSSSKSRERRKMEERDDNSMDKSDREKVVDERILQINKKNAEIMKRRQLIELEEKKFRLKVSPT